MNLIIPMAGIGKRLRPHTLTTPKPLIELAGKPIVEHLILELVAQVDQKIENIGFIIGDFGKEVEANLLKIALDNGAHGHIFYQKEALGTAHAILCAKPLLKGPVIIAFADTLFRATFKIDPSMDGVLWVHKVEDPSAFGVVELNSEGRIVSFVEKPKSFISDLAMIGIYYFKDCEKLEIELSKLIEENIQNGGEYQLPDALRSLVEKGAYLQPGKVEEWLDCGNYKVTLHTNARWLSYKFKGKLLGHKPHGENNRIILPCYIGRNVTLENSIIGPNVSIGEGTEISHSIIKNSIIGKQTQLSGMNLDESMIGNHTSLTRQLEKLSVGDYNTSRG
jgi:glucose-1-phosphate thymidylyltransferase